MVGARRAAECDKERGPANTAQAFNSLPRTACPGIGLSQESVPRVVQCRSRGARAHTQNKSCLFVNVLKSRSSKQLCLENER